MSEHQKHIRHTSASVCAPGVRMVAIQSWAYTEDNGELKGDHTIHPVVAIESSVAHRYALRMAEKGATAPVFGSHRELIKAGWKYEGCSISTKAFIVVDGLLQSAFEAFPEECSCALFTCDWPAAFDEQMLAEEIDTLHREAVDLTRRERS
jgi:hypothetical protein